MAKQQKSYSAVIIVLIIATVAFIWSNSLLDRAESGRRSQQLLELVAQILERLSIELRDPTDDTWLRKAAHLFEFALLGAELALLIRSRRRVSVQSSVNCLFAGMLTALADESIQIFSGRGSSVADVLLDFSGVLCGLLLALALSRSPARRRRG